MKKLLNKKIGIILGVVLIILLFVIGLDYKNIQVDRYNFEQLEKAKLVLGNIPKDAKKFYTLKEFNKLYNTDIKPIKNCYYISNDNGKEWYIFGFKIESVLYKIRYINWYYVYPKYDIPFRKFCNGNGTCDSDFNLNSFLGTISNPCQD